MRKFLTVFLVGVLICSLLAGCRKQDNDSSDTKSKVYSNEEINLYADKFKLLVNTYAGIHWLEQSPGNCLISSLSQYNTTYGEGDNEITNTAYKTIVSCLEADEYGENGCTISAEVMSVLKDSAWAVVYGDGGAICIYWSPSTDSNVWSAKQKDNDDYIDVPNNTLESTDTFENCIKSEQKRQQNIYDILKAQDDNVKERITDILNNTRPYQYYEYTIGQLIPYVFADYDLSYEPVDNEDHTYIVTVSGDYYATYGTNIVFNGEISYKVNISTGDCKVFDDPKMINSLMIVYAGKL